MPGVQIVAAADPDLDRARKTAARAYPSVDEMLEREQLDFLDIATRPECHLPLVRLAAARKLPAICQKPMAPTWSDAIAMVEAAEGAGIPLMIHENWRWQPWYRQAGRLIAAGAIGRPVSYTFRTRQRDGLGELPYPNQPYFRQMPKLLIHETLVHHIDTARFLFGEIRAVTAHARRVNPIIQGEDQALMLLTHENALEGIIDGHRFSTPEPAGPAMGEAWFEGDEAVLHVLSTGDLYLGAEKVWRNEVTAGYKGDSVRATQQHFLDCLAGNAPFESGGREYLEKTFAVVEAAYRSIAHQRSVAIAEITATP
jgi:predicted dehydrogenase